MLIQLVGVEFFNDILVPPDLLLDGARLWGPPSLSIPQAIGLLTRNSDYADQVWIWDSEDGSSFYFDVGEIVRLRVEMEEWHDQIPNAPDPGDGSTTERKPPYSIIVGVPFLPFPHPPPLPAGSKNANCCPGLDADGWFGTYIVVVVVGILFGRGKKWRT